MLTSLSVLGVILFGLWLIAVSGLMLFAPARALHFVGKAGSTIGLNVIEHSLRLLAGLALLGAAAHAQAPLVFQIAGGFIAGSSLLILLLPRRWHAAYAQACARILQPWQVRVMAPASAVAGSFLIYAVT